jgi:anti-sigma factor (TIGR02949 family)
MSKHEVHPQDELQLWLDERLDPARAAEIQAHVAGCARCLREVDALRAVKTSLRRDLVAHEVPSDLRARVGRALDAEGPDQRRSIVGRRAFVGTALAAAAVAAFLLLRPQPDLVDDAARDFLSFRADSLPMEMHTDDRVALEQHLAGANFGFPVRVFDFASMGYNVAGGGVHQIAGRRSALFVYRSDADARVLCQMFAGSENDLGPPDVERENAGVRFSGYERNGVAMVFWVEGDMLCLLALAGDMEAAMQMAFAKAAPG